MKKILLLFILFTPILLISQTPCASNVAGGFPCSDYDLMDHFDKATLSSRNGSDIWGWTDPLDNKEYALTTFEDKTCFLDVTDPVNPIYLGFLNTNAGSNYWRDVKVYQNHAFIVADIVGAHGMQVFDLTRLRSVASPPENFTADAVLTTGFGGSTIGSCHNIVINESKAIAYLVGCRSANGGGPIMIDISNPTSPVAVGQYTADGYTHDAQVVTYDGPDTDYTGKEIFIGSNESKVVVVDVTNPAAPTKISEVTYSNTAYTHQGWFNKNKSYFLVGDEEDEQNFGNNSRTIIFDFTDLDNLSYHSEFLSTSPAIDHNLYVKDDLVFQANYRAGLRVLNIADINNIVEVGYFDTYPANDSPSFNGAWSIYPYFASGNIIISDIDRGFFVVRKSGTLSVSDQVFDESGITIYPNPAINELKIASNKNNIEHLMLYSLLGQKIIDKKHSPINELVLDVSNLSEGFYFVKINNSYTQKIFVKK
ncbi:choice-of-anchor B family protein [Pseudofulvibacter geojedonensis]|uniref:Choice-of-anchor B family protein n=1 Tax=Pseudofulvibacter geojedonensis TaxID=1123758 RepID=A0ABW3I3H5_9FLAO